MLYEDNYLAHHGIIGMRWGVRRFQNEDGSYTQAGLERYRYDEGKYKEAKQKAKKVKNEYKSGNATKDEYLTAKAEKKSAKKQLSKAYDQVKRDSKADKGRRLYQSGRRIGESNAAQNVLQYGVAAAGNIAAYHLYSMGEVKKAAVVCAAGNAFLAGSYIRNRVLNSRMGAYYAHSRPSDLKPPKKNDN